MMITLQEVMIFKYKIAQVWRQYQKILSLIRECNITQIIKRYD